MKSEQQCAWIEQCQHEVWGSCYWCKQSYCANHLITVAVYEKNQGQDRIGQDDVCLCCLAQRYEELGLLRAQSCGWSLQKEALRRPVMELGAIPCC